jgi:hypothetical protein
MNTNYEYNSVGRFAVALQDNCKAYKHFDASLLADPVKRKSFADNWKRRARLMVPVNNWLKAFLISELSADYALTLLLALYSDKYNRVFVGSVKLPSAPVIPESESPKPVTLDYDTQLEVLDGSEALKELTRVRRSPKSLTAISRKVHNLSCEIQTLDSDSRAFRKAQKALKHQTRKLSGLVENKSLELKQTDLTRYETYGAKLEYKPRVVITSKGIEQTCYDLKETNTSFKGLLRFYCFSCKVAFNNRANKSAYKLYSSGCTMHCKLCGSSDIRVLDKAPLLERRVIKTNDFGAVISDKTRKY